MIEAGQDSCDGWSYVIAVGGPSWVRNDYLTDEPPHQTTSGGGGQPTGTVATSSTPPAPQSAPAPSATLVITTPDGEVVTLADLDGEAVLWGGELGFTLLGLVSSDQREADSICNPRSIYGNERSPTSIRNKEGLHGRPEGGSLFEPYYNSEFSAYNANATKPPMIVFGPGNQVGWLTANVSQFGNFAIDPDTLLFHLGSAS